MANATCKLDETVTAEFFAREDALLDRASGTTPEQFARHCRDLARRLERDQGLSRDQQQRRETRLTRTISPDGMYRLTGVFHPELGARIFTAIDHEVAALISTSGDSSDDRTALAAEALGELVSGGHHATRPAEAEIVVIVDQTTLADGLHEHSVCETDDGVTLPPETVRRLCCAPVQRSFKPTFKLAVSLIEPKARWLALSNVADGLSSLAWNVRWSINYGGLVALFGEPPIER